MYITYSIHVWHIRSIQSYNIYWLYDDYFNILAIQATGIETLIDGLEKKIMDALGLTGVVDNLKAAFKLDGFQQATTSLSSSDEKVSSYPNVC